MTKIKGIGKRKRVSKKNKISWRKHVDITDVEEFLEDKRLEERLGPPLETLANEELFSIDTKPVHVPILTAKERKELKLLQPPKCFSILQSYTKVPDPIKKRNRVRSKEERKNEILKKKEAFNRKNGIFKSKELQAMRDREVHELRRKAVPKRGQFDQDIWNEDEKLNEENGWFSKETIKHNLRGTGKVRKIVKTPTKPKSTVLPSVELPHPGMSYNPSYLDHQNLLNIIAEKEKEVIKEEQHLNRVTRDMFSKITANKRDESWLNEMSEGLPSDKKSQESEDDSDGEFKSINPPSQNKKKTLQQRRKQKEQRKLIHHREAAKRERKKVSDIHKLKYLKEQIVKRDAKVAKLGEKREKMKQLKRNEPKRLSALKFKESEIDFNLGSDIAGNLRNLKKEGNLLADRFNSMQKRNIIEPTVRRHRKKSKVKVYTKPGHKDEDWKRTVAR